MSFAITMRHIIQAGWLADWLGTDMAKLMIGRPTTTNVSLIIKKTTELNEEIIDARTFFENMFDLCGNHAMRDMQ